MPTRAIRSTWRLFRAARVLARFGVLDPLAVAPQAPPTARTLLGLFIRLTAWRKARQGHTIRPAGLSEALRKLGPSYIKLGQFLATRPDLVGAPVRAELARLQDHLPPFPRAQAIRQIEAELAGPLTDHFKEVGEPIAAASIAQVHFAVTSDNHQVAVKVLRPDVERAFASDLQSFYFAARLAERFVPQTRRLRPVVIVDTLADWVRLEMDFRMEAAAASEYGELNAADRLFVVPEVDWSRSARRVLTLDRLKGIRFSDRDAMAASGVDMAELSQRILRTFLTQATRDGVFHGDMHQGNLFLLPGGVVGAVDFGIMGRLDTDTRRFLAEILYGFLERDYLRVADLHFEAGYVPQTASRSAFAQALRAVGEPIFGRRSDEISMGRVLTQLFDVTETFGMETQPQLLLLQKTMVTVEGVARDLDPKANIWEAARPVIENWMWSNVGPAAQVQQTAERVRSVVLSLPRLAEHTEQLARIAGPEGLRVAAPPQPPAPPRRSRLLYFLLGGLAAYAATQFAGYF